MTEEVPAEVIASLEAKALEVRRHIIRMTYAAGSGHPGGSLSVTDLLAALYFRELRVDPDRPTWPDRDRLVLSKGHAAPALYATLAERGFLPREELLTLRKLGSRLQGHVDREKLAVIEASTGCLGQGIGMAVGMALDARLSARPSRVYAILDALAEARRTPDQPTAIVARTVKGKGVSFMEGKHQYHGKPPNKAEAEQALAELARAPGSPG